MKIFVAGATGALGKRLVPKLVEAGHMVTGTTRHAMKRGNLEAMGAKPLLLDALDRNAVISAVQNERPDVIVHELTAIPTRFNLRHFDREFGQTNRLRTEGTDNLIAAARASQVNRIVAQSYAGWPYAREGGPVKSEEDRLDPDPPKGFRRTFDAIRHLEAAVLGAAGLEGIVLRYGGFYGPGTAIGEGGSVLKDVRRRCFPLVGSAAGVWSFIHIDDAATATLAAVERGEAGIYNIVDDEPAPVSEWLPALASAIGAKRPLWIPAFLARFLVGDHGVAIMTQVRGASNAKAKRVLGWKPVFATWRDGFIRGLGSAQT